MCGKNGHKWTKMPQNAECGVRNAEVAGSAGVPPGGKRQKIGVMGGMGIMEEGRRQRNRTYTSHTSDNSHISVDTPTTSCHTGRETVKTVPLERLLETSIVPP